MFLIDALQIVFQAQQKMIDLHAPIDGAIVLGSAYNAISAALATQGLWIQADIIYWLGASALGHWAPLLYLFAAMAGMISMVLGQPPRNYVWYFMGPALFHWLVYTTTPVHGVMWGAPIGSVANESRQMTEVWKLSEPGLKNSNYINRNGISVYNNKAPSQPAEVASIFAWYDELISSQIRWFINWTGVYFQDENSSVGGANTNLCGYAGGLGIDETAWHVLSNIKWEVLEDITSARAHSIHTRDAFVQFMASECGDQLKDSMNMANYIAAQNSPGNTLQRSSGLKSVLADNGSANNLVYDKLTQKLATTAIPIPRPIQRLLKADQNQPGNFRTFLDSIGTAPDAIETKLNDGYIGCDLYFWMVVNAFRWEAGHVYWQAVTRKEIGRGEQDPTDIQSGTMRDQVVYALLYGWDVKKDQNQCLDFEEQNYFLVDLILMHLIRNEFAVAPQVSNSRYSSSQQTIQAVEGQARSVGSKSKYGELYTWAKMIPYLQGVLLYFLALSYPFACLMMVVPGWHKTLFTWASFYAWAKLWDLGFAMVTAIERSIWATIGNNPDVASVNGHIAKMQDSIRVNVACTAGGLIGDGTCPVPAVTGADGTTWNQVVEVFDKALLFTSSLDYDLLNSYYIYIMAALYFAVPAVTGQLVLGARSGAAGMVNSMVGGVSGQAGAQAGQAFTARYMAGLRGAETNFQQQTAGKSQRKQGQAGGGQFAAAQLASQAMEGGIAESHANQMGQIEGLRGTVANYQKTSFESGMGVMSAGFGVARSAVMGNPNRGRGGSGGRMGSGGDGRFGSQEGGVIGAVGRRMFDTGSAAMAFGGKIAGNNVTQGYLAADFEGNRASKMQGIAGAQMGGRKSMNEAMSGRMGKLGQFQMAEDMYDASANYAQGIVNQAASFGVSAGSISPTQLSTDVDGMQGAGMLNFQDAAGRGWSRAPQSHFNMPTTLMGQVDNQARAQTGLLNSIMQPRGIYGSQNHMQAVSNASGQLVNMFNNQQFWSSTAAQYGPMSDQLGDLVGRVFHD
ncbi:MAG: hypothetical protein R3A13_08305 [Bdellovibrionota bacterium]